MRTPLVEAVVADELPIPAQDANRTSLCAPAIATKSSDIFAEETTIFVVP